MESPQPEERDGSFFDGWVQQALLGSVYVAVGIGLFYSLAVGSTELLVVVLSATLVVTVLSLGILVVREGLLTAENRLIGVFVLVSMGLLFGLSVFTTLPEGVVYGVVVVIGILIPNRLLKHGDYGRES